MALLSTAGIVLAAPLGSHSRPPEEKHTVLSYVTKIPRSYLMAGNYKVHLSITEMQIDHMAQNSRLTMKNRTCLITLGYVQPIGNNLFSSRFEVPLIGNQKMGFSNWVPASTGDYVLHFSNTPVYSATLQLGASIRF